MKGALLMKPNDDSNIEAERPPTKMSPFHEHSRTSPMSEDIPSFLSNMDKDIVKKYRKNDK